MFFSVLFLSVEPRVSLRTSAVGKSGTATLSTGAGTYVLTDGTVGKVVPTVLVVYWVTALPKRKVAKSAWNFIV